MSSKNNDVPSIDAWCRTKAGEEEVKFTFAWKIERFSQRPERIGQHLLSSIFTIHGPNNQKNDWRIELYPKGFEEEVSDFLSVYLQFEGVGEVLAKWSWIQQIHFHHHS